MQRIPISSLKAGMVVAKAITNDSGMVLLSVGTALTDSLITRLNRMDLQSIWIEGASETAKSRDEMLADLDSRFRKTGNEPYMNVIKGAIKTRIEEVYK
ncbi:MAG TPA: hypothetical protein VK448_07935 [Dissulfurispiraceae bacterium]|nr:hypothetical protein [Dissulfurispiraceae bacterium]